MGWSLFKALGIKPASKPSTSELFTGVPTPSSILIGMVVQTMYKDLKNIKGDTNFYSISGKGLGHSWFWGNGKIEISWKWKDRGGYDSISWEICDITLSFDKTDFTLSPQELKTLKKDLLGLMLLKKEFDSQEKEAGRQQKAVDLIEELFKPKPITPPPAETPQVEEGKNDNEFSEFITKEKVK